MFIQIVIKMLSQVAVQRLIIAGLKELAKKSKDSWDDEFIGEIEKILEGP